VSKAADAGSTSGEKTWAKSSSAPGCALRDGLVRGGGHLGLDLGLHGVEAGGVEEAVRQEERLHPRQRVELDVLLPVVLGPVEPVVVGEGVRVGADDVGVDEGRALSLAAVGEGPLQGVVGGEEVAAVDLGEEEAGVPADDLGDRAAGRVHLDRGRDRELVVLDEEEDGEPARRGGVESLPELPFGGRPVADRDDGDLVLREPGRGAEEPARLRAREEAPRLGHADAGKALGAGRRGGREDVEAPRPPVGGHLAAGGGLARLRADGRQEHLQRRHAEAEAESPVAVVGEEPVDARLHQEGGGDLDRLVPGPADLEEDAVLPLQLDLPVVQPAGGQREPVGPDEVVGRQAVERRLGRGRDFGRHRHPRVGKWPRGGRPGREGRVAERPGRPSRHGRGPGLRRRPSARAPGCAGRASIGRPAAGRRRPGRSRPRRRAPAGWRRARGPPS
jgi:hypothetical protein